MKQNNKITLTQFNSSYLNDIWLDGFQKIILNGLNGMHRILKSEWKYMTNK